MMFFSTTAKPRSRASCMIVSRVIPGRIEVESGGVEISPSLTMNTFSPGPSAT